MTEERKLTYCENCREDVMHCLCKYSEGDTTAYDSQAPKENPSVQMPKPPLGTGLCDDCGMAIAASAPDTCDKKEQHLGFGLCIGEFRTVKGLLVRILQKHENQAGWNGEIFRGGTWFWCYWDNDGRSYNAENNIDGVGLPSLGIYQYAKFQKDNLAKRTDEFVDRINRTIGSLDQPVAHLEKPGAVNFIGADPAAPDMDKVAAFMMSADALKMMDMEKVADAAFPKRDNVHSPSHYNTGKIEVIEFIEDQKLDVHRGSAVKYVCRAGRKDASKEVEDLQKAIWYLERKVELLTAERQKRAPKRPNEMRKR